MSESNQSLYVKMRGRVLGPFDPNRLQQMAKMGQLSRTHMLSEDGDNWRRAGEYPELFISDANQVEPTSAPAAEELVTTERPSANWHYSLGDQPIGPVTLTDLRNLVTSGQLGPNELVWKESMDDWVSIQSIPELAAIATTLATDLRAIGEPQVVMTTVGSTQMGQHTSGKNSELRNLVESSQGWVFFLVIVFYVLSALLFGGFIVSLVLGARTENPVMIGYGVGLLIQMGVLFTMTLFLNRYASNCRLFVDKEDMNYFNEAQRWLGRVWVLLGIVMIIYLVAFFTLFIIALSTEAAL